MVSINVAEDVREILMDRRDSVNTSVSKVIRSMSQVDAGECSRCEAYQIEVDALKQDDVGDCPDCGGYQATINTLQYKLDNNSPTVDNDSLTNLTSEVERLLAENETLRTSKDGAFVLLLEDENARYKKEIAKMKIELEAWNVQE